MFKDAIELINEFFASDNATAPEKWSEAFEFIQWGRQQGAFSHSEFRVLRGALSGHCPFFDASL